MYVGNDGNEDDGGYGDGDCNSDGDGDNDGYDAAAAADSDNVNEDNSGDLRMTIGRWQLVNNNGMTTMRC